MQEEEPTHFFLQIYFILKIIYNSFPGLTRPAMYPFAGGAYPYPMLGPEMSQVAASW